MTETEWRNLGVQQSPGWIHYMVGFNTCSMKTEINLYYLTIFILQVHNPGREELVSLFKIIDS